VTGPSATPNSSRTGETPVRGNAPELEGERERLPFGVSIFLTLLPSPACHCPLSSAPADSSDIPCERGPSPYPLAGLTNPPRAHPEIVFSCRLSLPVLTPLLGAAPLHCPSRPGRHEL